VGGGGLAAALFTSTRITFGLQRHARTGCHLFWLKWPLGGIGKQLEVPGVLAASAELAALVAWGDSRRPWVKLAAFGWP